MNIGCRLNYAELDYLATNFQKIGKDVDWSGEGDVFLVNTCAVTKEAERKSFSIIRRCARQKPVIVTGCLVELAKEKIEKIPGVCQIVSPREKEALIENTLPMPSRSRALLKIVDGCPRACVYCVVSKIRGEVVRSKAEDIILNEVSFLIKKGFSEICLTGLNLGLYGSERNSSISHLLRQIFEKCPGNFRIRLSSLEPDLIGEDLIKTIANLPVCRHIHMPIQSFDDHILKKMGRSYLSREVKDKIEMIFSYLPEVNIGCDIIVGFSGETDEAFAKTRESLEDIPFGYFHIFPFSPRPKTTANSLPDDVSPKEKRRRVNILRELGRRKREEYQRKFLGKRLLAVREREGLVVTDNYLRVKVLNQPVPLGIFPVQIKNLSRNWLEGEF